MSSALTQQQDSFIKPITRATRAVLASGVGQDQAVLL